MKRFLSRRGWVGCCLLALVVSPTARGAAPLGTGFTYQGHLRNGGIPVNGSVNLGFSLYDAVMNGNLIGSQAVNGVNVINGLFTVVLNGAGQLGSTAFDGEARWLEISVNGTPVTPRQAVTATPYALRTRGIDGHSLDAADGSPIDALFVDNSGRVGIGTTSPTAPLQVAAESDEDGIRTTGSVYISKAFGTAEPGLTVTRATAVNPFLLNVWMELDGAKIDAFGSLIGSASVQINSDSSGNVNLAQGGGRVGVGTGTPGQLLQVGDVDTADSEGMIRLESRSGTQGSNRAWDIGVPETDGDSSGVGYSFVIDDTQFGSTPEVMVKWGSGNVGIGTRTTTPSTKLHIDGGTDSDETGGGYVTVGDTASINLSMDDNEIMARNNSATAPLFLNNEGGNVHLCVEGGGVSIGTTAVPAGVLLAVDGKVLCEELEVQLSGDWPDYVFAEGYELMPLDRLEEAVRASKHLPGVPSAATIAAEGLRVGEMQSTLLRKVEELTLYLIDMNKELASVKQENETLRNRLSALEGGSR